MTNTPELLIKISKQVGKKLDFYVDAKNFDLDKIFREIMMRREWDLYEEFSMYVAVDSCTGIYDQVLKTRGENFRDTFIWFKKMRLEKFKSLQRVLA